MSQASETTDRHTSEAVVNKRRMSTKQMVLLCSVGVVCAGAAGMVYSKKDSGPAKKWHSEQKLALGTPQNIEVPRDDAPVKKASLVIPPLPSQAAPKPLFPAQVTPPPLPPASKAATPPAAPHLLVYAAAAPAAPQGPSAEETRAGVTRQAQASAMKPTIIQGWKATRLQHPEFTVPDGAMIPCTLENAIDTQLPGGARCVVTADVYGAAGHVSLIPRGSTITGEIHSGSGVQRGQNRAFILWKLVRTPENVVVSLDSPATDALGRSGIEGNVNSHFWERFGGTILVTLIQGAMQTASSAASSVGSTSLNLGDTGEAATEALRNSINIPPTITVNQGQRMAVQVHGFLDLSDVYGLELTGDQ